MIGCIYIMKILQVNTESFMELLEHAPWYVDGK